MLRFDPSESEVKYHDNKKFLNATLEGDENENVMGAESNDDFDEDTGSSSRDNDENENVDFSEDYGHEYEPLLQTYARDKLWLEKATENILDFEQYPLGTLTKNDEETIVGLMVAWSRKGSIEAALLVERLLKRIIDDMKSNSPNVQASAKMYTVAMDGWAKSRLGEEAALRAQHIHETMVRFYRETKNENLKPTTYSYNVLINAHARSGSTQALDSAVKVLHEMIENDDIDTYPDATTFGTLLDACPNDENGVQRAKELFDYMDEIKVERNQYTYGALQKVYAFSNLQDAPQKVIAVLEEMLKLYEKGNLWAKPHCGNFNFCLGTLSRTTPHNRASAEMAQQLITKMETPVEDGGYDVEPDKLSYALAILACARYRNNYGTSAAEGLLLRMEAKVKEVYKKRKELSSAAPPSVMLDLESFNIVLTAISKSRATDAVERIIAIIGRMKQYAKYGHAHVMPTVRSWNALLNAMARSEDGNAGPRAEQVMKHMYQLHNEGVPDVKPNSFSYVAVLSAYKKSTDLDSAERADAIVRKMEVMHQEGQLETPPDVYHYTTVIRAWAHSKLPIAADRAVQIFGHMKDLAAKGHKNADPNIRTYNSVLECLARNGAAGEAEKFLDHMIMMDLQGRLRVNAISFNCAINAFSKSQKKGSGKRAEAVLDRLLEFSEHAGKASLPQIRSFELVIEHYGRSPEPDAPYRAEYVLNRMIELFKTGHSQLQPDNRMFELVMGAYAAAKHPDSGTTAERLIQQMKELQSGKLTTKIKIDRSVLQSALLCWSVSGDEDAGLQAERHLDFMERQFESCDHNMKPNSRTYGLVLNCWSKSSSFDKASRTLGVLKRMEEQQRKGNDEVFANQHAHSLVINACAFTNAGPDVEAEAFRIAVATFDKMLASDDIKPASLTFGWFIQACGRLNVPTEMKIDQIERAWKTCCEMGLVNAFVLNRFTGAASESLYKKLLSPVLGTESSLGWSKEQIKFQLSPEQLPLDWTRNCTERNPNRAGGDWWEKQ